MPKYMFKGSYTAEGIRGVLAEGGTARREAGRAAWASLGGKLEAFYFTFGADDVIAIGELPDDQSAAAFAMDIASSGEVTVETTVLLTPAQIDQACEHHAKFRAPGK